MVVYCEVCGRPTDRAYVAKIEGATLVVCESCAERGEVVSEYTGRSVKRSSQTYVDLVDGFGRRIKEARKRLRMDLNELSRATRISVKTLKLIEEEKIIPTAEQVARIEKALGITLREEEDFDYEPKGDFTLTLGDVVRIR